MNKYNLAHCYRMQGNNPCAASHNIETWNRMKHHAEHNPVGLFYLDKWAGGHARDGGDGAPFVRHCIRHGWITRVNGLEMGH